MAAAAPEVADKLVEAGKIRFRVRLCNFRGRELQWMDEWSHKSDPYLHLYFAEEKMMSTEIIDADLNPVWKFDKSFIFETDGGIESLRKIYFKIKCYDHDLRTEDEEIGSSRVSLFKLATGSIHRHVVLRWKHQNRGEIMFDCFMQVVTNIKITITTFNIPVVTEDKKKAKQVVPPEGAFLEYVSSLDNKRRKTHPCPFYDQPEWDDFEPFVVAATKEDLIESKIRVTVKTVLASGKERVLGTADIYFEQLANALTTASSMTFDEKLKGEKGEPIGGAIGDLHVDGMPTVAQEPVTVQPHYHPHVSHHGAPGAAAGSGAATPSGNTPREKIFSTEVASESESDPESDEDEADNDPERLIPPDAPVARMMAAVRANDLYKVRTFFERSRPEAPTVMSTIAEEDGSTPRAEIPRGGSQAFAQLLDARRVVADGAYPLHAAAALGLDDMCSFLMTAGFDTSRPDHRMLIPLDHAIRAQHLTTATTLHRTMQRIQRERTMEQSAMDTTVASGHNTARSGQSRAGLASATPASRGRGRGRPGSRAHVTPEPERTPTPEATVIMPIELGCEFARLATFHSVCEKPNYELASMMLRSYGPTLAASRDMVSGNTALHLAVLASQTEKDLIPIINALMAAGADVNAKRTKDGATPLLLTVSIGQDAIAEQLIRHKATVDMTDGNDETPLMVAVHIGADTIVTRLLAASANPNFKTPDGTTPLHKAAAQNKPSLIPILLQRRAQMNARDGSGRTPLMVACEAGAEAAVNALFAYSESNQPDVLARDKQGRTALSLAANDDIRIVLQNKNATRSYDDELMEAVEKGDVVRANQLVQFMSSSTKLRLANIRARDATGLSALHHAARRGNCEMIQLLLDADANVDELTPNNWSPLLLAAYHGHVAAVGLLVEKGAQVAFGDLDGMTALHVAACGHADTVNELLNRGADVNSRTKAGWTPLFCAAYNGCLEAVEVLIARKADVDALSSSGRAAIECASTPGITNALKKATKVK